MSMNLSSIIAHHAGADARRPALSLGEVEYTYADLYGRTQRVAGALREAGVGRETVVAVLLHNSLEFLELMCATAHVGGIFMPLNWRLAPAELSYICGHADASVVVSEPDLAAQLGDFAAQADVKSWFTLGPSSDRWRALEEAVAAATPVDDPVDVDGDDVHRLMYTSGTTSRPKGVMITYANVYWKCAGQIVELQMTSADRGLIAGPLYHVGALDLTMTNLLYVGAFAHIIRRFDPIEVVEAIEKRRISNVWLAPAMVNALLASGATEGRDLGSVRLIIDGGEKMPLPLIERILTTFPNAWFADAYGLTETVSGDTFLDKGKVTEKLGSVGKPILHTDVRILDLDDEPVPAGQHGEIVVRGPKVCRGYWRDPDATATAMRNGWFHTGDIGYLDEDGYLFIVDRLKDVIISGGENVASLEVERVVYEHPEVLEVAVVGRPDPRWNEVPVAYVVLKVGSTLDEPSLDAFCSSRLARFKTPKGFRFVDALPRNPSGKVLKRELREREAAASSAPPADGAARP
jgi:acyl-CoA synthetase (AMP-forming)/AMP-acid ligase II